MHEIHDIEFELWDEAERLSEKYCGAPVVIIIGGHAPAGVGRCMLSSTLHNGSRLRDLLGVLETLKHFRVGAFGKKMAKTEERRRARIQRSRQANRSDS